MKLITFNWCTKQIMEMKNRWATSKPFFSACRTWQYFHSLFSFASPPRES